MHSELFTFRKQQLEPQTDSQERLSRPNRSLDRRNQSILIQIRHAITERSDSRQDHMAGILNRRCIARNHRLVPHRFKGLGDTTKISHPIVNNSNHMLFTPKGS